MTTRNNRHLAPQAARMVGDVAIYLSPSDEGGWAVEAINMMGEVVAEVETFAARETAERYVAELVKDLS